MPLDNIHRQQILSSYNSAFKRHGFHANALLWSSKEVQELRFSKIAEIAIKSGDSILDVGCGFGHFAGFLVKLGLDIQFTGIDLSENFIIEGRKHYPDADLQVGDLFDYNPAPNHFDYLTLSGTLNNKLNDNGDYAHQVIKRLFASCRKGIAFNLLDARHQWTASRWDLQSFHPEEIIALLEPMAERIELIDDYLENDFTVLAWKDSATFQDAY
ncbi:MAG: class I SAM-dependent methyltransferase [Thiotrichaceae bacterium]|nr:class I SAM-dependent methyltransferase [Thiotrichaceae bacterium]